MILDMATFIVITNSVLNIRYPESVYSQQLLVCYIAISLDQVT